MMRPSAASGGIGGSSSAGGGSAQHGGAGDARAVVARQGEMLEMLLDCSAQAVKAARVGDVPAPAAPAAAVAVAKGAAGKGKASGSSKGAGKQGGQNPVPRPTNWELIEYSADEIAGATDCLNPAKVAGRGLYGSLFEATLRGRAVVIKRLQLDPDTLAATAPALPLLTHLRAEAKAHVASARAARAIGLRDTIFDARTAFPFVGESAAQVRRRSMPDVRAAPPCPPPPPPSSPRQTIEAMVAAVELAVAGVRGDVDIDGKPAATLGPHPDDVAAAEANAAGDSQVSEACRGGGSGLPASAPPPRCYCCRATPLSWPSSSTRTSAPSWPTASWRRWRSSPLRQQRPRAAPPAPTCPRLRRPRWLLPLSRPRLR